jgi:quinoprotein glucose dehydrogenase
VRTADEVRNTVSRAATILRTASIALILVVVGCEEPDADWTHWAADPQSSRYTPLRQIDATNFEQLEEVWRWRSPDRRLRAKLLAKKLIRSGRLIVDDFAGTPLEVAGVLYGITSLSQVYALDATTGQLIWLHDTKSWGPEPWQSRHPKHRGLAYWDNGEPAEPPRIFAATLSAHLVALDAATGEPIEGFGNSGRVDLMASLRAHQRLNRGSDYFHASPPAIYKDVVIVGGTVSDAVAGTRGTPGDVRAYDARTGTLRWTFHTVPKRNDPAWQSWQGESALYTGAANAWASMSVDTELGFVYAATSTPTNDFYGGHRQGDNEYAETLVCLDARTGERVWHQQLIRHGIWDYDIAAAPNLVDIEVDGRPVRAVAQATKQSMVFVFDRETGEPVWPIEDRPVPASSVPGERTAETQRFPSKPLPFDRQGTRAEDLIDFTPELRAQAQAVFDQFDTGPVFMPPSLVGTLFLPGSNGGANWHGMGYDPGTQTLFVPSITLPTAMGLDHADRSKTDVRFVPRFLEPPLLYGMEAGVGISIFKPPWSRITAIDLKTGDFRWQVPNGDGPRDHELLRELDLPALGSGAPTCVIVTDTLLIAPDGSGPWLARNGEPLLRAYDKATGQVVGKIKIPGRVRGCPMSYSHDGAQYIVLPLLPAPDGMLVALALPEQLR